MKWDQLSPKLKKLIIHENPQDFDASGIKTAKRSVVHSLADPQRKPYERSALQDQVMAGSQDCLGFRVAIISLRKRMVDGHDNLRTGAKPLVDRITEWLGFKSDNDPRLEWDYHQIIVSGQPGTVVQITPFLCAPRSKLTKSPHEKSC